MGSLGTAPVEVMATWAAKLVIDNEEIGVATNVSFDEDYGLEPITVLNHYGPLDHKVTRWSCRVTTGIYLLDTANEQILQKTPSRGALSAAGGNTKVGGVGALTVGPVDIVVINKLSGVTKHTFSSCRTQSRNASFASGALVSGGAVWLGVDHVQ